MDFGFGFRLFGYMSANQTAMDANLQHELELFGQALQLTDPAARAAFLDRACGANPSLRQRLEALLKAHLEAGTFLGAPPTGVRTLLDPPDTERLTEQPGDRIGRYKLLQQIGEGGCGIVYMAEQEEPVRRRVALKVIKLGMDTKSVIARFEAERQALALMDHPNIAKVLDAGATDSGRPYFVMELVRGVRLTDYCDEAKLPMPERLQLFIQVCQAIQHAHQKGIIHRDIKPSNILVTVNDGVPVPKVIDFGIAKATNQQRLTDKTLFTAFEQFIGTPAYMSPEQAVMTSLDIDTRSDIYALGVLLYELITGRTPFDAQQLLQAGLDEIRRTIREVEPPRPSTRLSTMLSADLTTVAQRRHAEPAKLATQIRGDLDWIVMKALEKDRTRRYESATGLAADIQRHLENEPVTARPPSTTYRLQKLIRRNRTASLATAAIAITLLFALTFSTTAFLRERKARLQTLAAERAREFAHRQAESETVRADTVAKFVTELFNDVIPELDQRGHREAIRQLIDVADRLASRLTNAPRAEAELRFYIGNGYGGTLGDYASEQLQYQKIERLGSILGNEGEHLNFLARERRLVSEMADQNSTNSLAVLMQISNEALRRSPPDTDAAAHALANAASSLSYFGDDVDAARLARESLRIAPNDRVHLVTRMVALEVLARTASKRGLLTEAENAADELLETLRVHPSRDSTLQQHALQHFVRVIWNGDPSLLPEAALKRAINSLQEEDGLVQGYLRALLGIASARSGEWQRGLDLLSTSVSNSFCNVGLWADTTHLAVLTGNLELYRSLRVSGLIRFGGGADPDTSRLLVEPLLVVVPEPAFLPTIQKLVARGRQGASWNRICGQLTLALLEYRTGRYRAAKDAIDSYLREGTAIFIKDLDPYWARGWFLRSSIETKLGNSITAQDSYSKGLRFHSIALRAPGTAYTGNEWGASCQAELLRREAAALLGEAVPPDPPAPGQP